MLRIMLFCATLALVGANCCSATDINGKWNGKMQGPNGEMELVFVFKVTGEVLTGTVEGPMGEMALTNCKMNGNEFSFDVDAGDMTIGHKCKILADGTISMKTSGMPDGEGTEIILKRIPAEPAKN